MATSFSGIVRRIPLPGRLLAVALVAAAAATVAVATVGRPETRHITAYFTSATGLYAGDPVTVRGVPIGSIERIEPLGDRVRVRFNYDAEQHVPADTRAVVVSPTLVSGRYIQLTTAGPDQPDLPDGAEIPLERTAVPIEYDRIKRQLDELATEIGPSELGTDGSLSRLSDAAAAALSGNGATLKQTLTNVSAAVQTLAQGGPDLFTTIRNLQTLVSALAANDRQITQFTGELSALSRLLDDNRTQLDAAVQAVEAMLPAIRTFVQDNRGALVKDVDELNRIAALLADRQDDLAQILHVAPTTLSDLYNIYDPDSRTLTAAVSIADYPEPMSFLCALLTTVDAPQEECSRASRNFGAALRATQPPPAVPPPGQLPTLLVPGAGGGR